MKRNLLLFTLLAAGALPAEVFTSPNGRVACDFALRDGVPVAVVSYDGRRVFEGELGFRRAKAGGAGCRVAYGAERLEARLGIPGGVPGELRGAHGAPGVSGREAD